jgi:hypothetical protein
MSIESFHNLLVLVGPRITYKDKQLQFSTTDSHTSHFVFASDFYHCILLYFLLYDDGLFSTSQINFSMSPNNRHGGDKKVQRHVSRCRQ